MDKTILIIDDNETMCEAMTETLRRSGYKVMSFTDSGRAIKYFEQAPASLVITDLRMAPINGLGVLKTVKKINPKTEVLLISAYGTVASAVQAMNGGAADFLTKPFSNDELRLRVKRLFDGLNQDEKLERISAQNRYLNEEIEQQFPGVIGRSPAMKRVLALIEKTAPVESAILISGESGTGKELAARAIHRKSPRKDAPFIRVNCAALNDNLLESELFGHEKGAFTGALNQRKGRFELADGGTLFLDEIGDISPAMQVRMLRALQEKEFERVGGEKTLRVDVRIIAASNKNLKELVAKGAFREDLYYRLNVIPIHLPPLRERPEDIPVLAEHLLRKHQKPGGTVHFTAQAMQALKNYDWPGNIRELENIIERTLVIVNKDEIDAQDLTGYLEAGGSAAPMPEKQTLNEALAGTEKKLIAAAMEKAGNVKSRAARLLGIKTATLYYKLEKYNLL